MADSDEEHRSPAKGHQPRQQQYASANSYVVREIKPEPAASSSYNGASLSQKKRLLAKAQTECSLMNKPKQEQVLPDGYAEYGGVSGDRSSMAQQPCDFSSNGTDALHFQPIVTPASQQARGYRADYDQQQQHRDYLQPPAAHRQQRYDTDSQQPREQNGYYGT